jgi:hypothetical protein
MSVVNLVGVLSLVQAGLANVDIFKRLIATYGSTIVTSNPSIIGYPICIVCVGFRIAKILFWDLVRQLFYTSLEFLLQPRLNLCNKWVI